MHRKCEKCLKWQEDYGKDVACVECPDGVYRNEFSTAIPEYVTLPTYGKVLKSRLKELQRRVILPYNPPDGGYFVGRRGENGKVAERLPDYR